MKRTTHTADRKSRCNLCRGIIDPGERMTTTFDDGLVTVTHEACTPTPVPSEIFGVVQDALKAAKELA